MDQHFGEGSSTRLINHYSNVDWAHTFERIIGIICHSLSDSEKQFVASEVRDWLQAFIESDGLEEEEQTRLDEFYQWFEDAGLEKVKFLSLHNNQLTDLKGLEKLTQLTHLVLGHTQLTDVKGLEKLTAVSAFVAQRQPRPHQGAD